MAYAMYCPKCKWAGEINTAHGHQCPDCKDRLWTSRGTDKEVEGWLKLIHRRREKESNERERKV